MFLTDAWFADTLAAILAAGERFGGQWAEPRQRIQVEMVSANPTGPMTVAAARNGAYGDSVARLLEFAGHGVEREYYYNDAGAQMDRFRASVEAVRRGEEPPEDGYDGDYIAELAREEGDPVAAMREQIEASLERFRVHFDSLGQPERDGEARAELLPRLDTYESDGTLWARTTAYGDDKDRPLMRSSDGSFLYFAADIAYVHDKFERGFDTRDLRARRRSPRLRRAPEGGGGDARLRPGAGRGAHLPARASRLRRRQTKMSKRRGDVVFLDDFIEEIGVDAARWYLVNRGPDQTIEIDVDLAAERSAKNPMYYVQYAHARIAGILRNAGDAEVHRSRGPRSRRRSGSS